MENWLIRQNTCARERLAGQLRGLAAMAAKIIICCCTLSKGLKDRRIRSNPRDRNLLLMEYEAMALRQRDLT